MTEFIIHGIRHSEKSFRSVSDSSGVAGWWGRQADYAKSVVESLDEHRELKRLAKAQGMDGEQLWVTLGMQDAKAVLQGQTISRTISSPHDFWLMFHRKALSEEFEESLISELESDGKEFEINFGINSKLLDRCRLSWTRA